MDDDGVVPAWQRQTAQLFQEHATPEIQTRLQGTRKTIEQKKEDLRQMVGEQYRDLIDAADTIVKMASSTAQVMGAVSHMQQLCSRMQSLSFQLTPALADATADGGPVSRSTSSNGSTSAAQNATIYDVAVQAKFLMDTPEQVWSALEARRMYCATHLYQLALSTYSRLKVDTTPATVKLLAKLPLLPRQWTAISHFRQSILDASRQALQQDQDVEAESLGALASLVLLENISLEQALQEFLNARRAALAELCRKEVTTESVETQICAILSLLLATAKRVAALFEASQQPDTAGLGPDPDAEPEGLLLAFLKAASSLRSTQHEQDFFVANASLGTSATLLGTDTAPAFVRDFRPSCETKLVPLDRATLQRLFGTWLSECVELVQPGASKQLRFVASIKSLASIRDAAWHLLKADLESKVPATNVASKLLGEDAMFWDQFLRACFSQRAQAILSGKFRDTASSAFEAADEALAGIDEQNKVAERDMTAYLWSPGSLASAAAGRGGDAAAPDGGLSAVQALSSAVTPGVARVRATVDSGLASLFDEAQHLLAPDEASVSITLARARASEDVVEPFKRFGDSDEIKRFVQAACEQFVDDCLAHVETRRASVAAEITVQPGQASEACGANSSRDSSSDDRGLKVDDPDHGATAPDPCADILDPEALDSDASRVDKLLFLGRVCTAIAEHCSLLEKLMLLPAAAGEFVPATQTSAGRLFSSRAAARRAQMAARGGRGSQVSEHEQRCRAAKSKLSDKCLQCQASWATWVAATRGCRLKSWLNRTSWVVIPAKFGSWQVHTVEEESEDGAKVKTTIRLPVQPSPFVLGVLSAVCGEISRAGGYAMDKKTLILLAHDLAANFTRAYSSTISSSDVSQDGLLQLMVDAQLAGDVLLASELHSDGTSGGARSGLASVVRSIRTRIDPFDLDVYAPFLDDTRSRIYQRCGVLLGLLTHLKPLSQTTSSAMLSSSESHNMLPLAPVAPRLPLLPVGGRSTQASSSTVAPAASETFAPTANSTFFESLFDHHHG
eukprot:m.48551 g.48551  ORF g.48551 m.48551 type:complete len:1022 (+) comp12009_c0_seq2:147-3212(+)